MTHDEVAGRFTNYLVERHLATDPNEKQKKKDLAQLNKEVQAYEKALEKDEAVKRKKEEEKADMSRLTCNEKSELKSMKSEEQLRKKNAKNEAEAEKKRRYQENKQKLSNVASMR